MSKDGPQRVYQLADYEQVFAAADNPEVSAVLVGGQAVYFWATRFRAKCPVLDTFLPYTSQDADYLADVVSAQRLARALHSHFQPAPRRGGVNGTEPGANLTVRG